MSRLSDAVLTVYFQPGSTINRNGINSINSSLVTIVLQDQTRIEHSNMPDLSEAVLVYFKPGASVNQNRLNSTFISFDTLIRQGQLRLNLLTP